MSPRLRYISAFFLLLSLSFLLPVRYGHDCLSHTHEEKDQVVKILADILAEEVSPDCILCELEFPPFLQDKSCEFRDIVPDFSYIAFSSYQIPHLEIVEPYTQRGPPQAFEA